MPTETAGGLRTTGIILDRQEWKDIEMIRAELRHRHRSQTVRELLNLGIKAYRQRKKLLEAVEASA